MRVFIERENKRMTLAFIGTGKELLATLKINPETVLIVKNKTVVTEDENLSNTDELDILSVISGG
jgi:sulfur carrier protein ThiS